MANYASIQDAINAGTANMTVLRNNVKNDDGTTQYATGIDWFKFNGVTVTSIFSSGNSWLGFGTSAEQLKVNRRDAAVWYEYSEVGIIGLRKFYRFRWEGNSRYSSTNSETVQKFEVFLFDNGQIMLNFFVVPTWYVDYNCYLVCGGESVGYSMTLGVPCEYTFTPSNPSAGTGWSVSTERPDTGHFKSSGDAVITLSNFTPSGGESLFWQADTPTGTSLSMYTKVNNGSWIRVQANGGAIQGLPNSGSCTLHIKAELETTVNTSSPIISEITIRNNNDKKILVLTSNIPNFSSAVGDMTVSYDGLGGLRGFGGPTAAFNGVFTPSGLTWKGHQNDAEHVDMSISATAVNIPITYINAKSADEHVNMSIDAVATLTDIHDI